LTSASSIGLGTYCQFDDRHIGGDDADVDAEKTTPHIAMSFTYSPYRPKQRWSLPNRYILSIIGLLFVMAVSVTLAIIFPYVDPNDPSRTQQMSTNTATMAEVGHDTDASNITGSSSNGNHQPNLFDLESNIEDPISSSSSSSLQIDTAMNDTVSSSETITISPEGASSCQSLLQQADDDSSGMIDSIEYRNFIDKLKVSDLVLTSNADIMASFDFGAYSLAADGLPTSLKLKFVSLSSSSSKDCLNGETTAMTTVICIGSNSEGTSGGSNNNNGELDYICEETMQVMEEIVGGRMRQ
jgi:hypothetical protein